MCPIGPKTNAHCSLQQTQGKLLCKVTTHTTLPLIDLPIVLPPHLPISFLVPNQSTKAGRSNQLEAEFFKPHHTVMVTHLWKSKELLLGLSVSLTMSKAIWVAEISLSGLLLSLDFCGKKRFCPLKSEIYFRCRFLGNTYADFFIS